MKQEFHLGKVFGIDITQLPTDSRTWDRIIQSACEDSGREYNPQHSEEPRISPETLKTRIRPRRR